MSGIASSSSFVDFESLNKDDEKKKHSNEDLEWIYNQVFGEAVEYMRDFDVQAVAATYMAIAMRLYKTHLDEK